MKGSHHLVNVGKNGQVNIKHGYPDFPAWCNNRQGILITATNRLYETDALSNDDIVSFKIILAQAIGGTKSMTSIAFLGQPINGCCRRGRHGANREYIFQRRSHLPQLSKSKYRHPMEPHLPFPSAGNIAAPSVVTATE